MPTPLPLLEDVMIMLYLNKSLNAETCPLGKARSFEQTLVVVDE